MGNTRGLEWPGEPGHYGSRTDMRTGLLRAERELATACVCMRRYEARGVETEGQIRFPTRKECAPRREMGVNSHGLSMKNKCILTQRRQIVCR